MKKTAWLSSCGRYRHALGRYWDESLGYVLFIGLNPSTADAESDDPTVRRCIGYSKDWGYGGIEICNPFDWRATNPRCIPRASFAVSEYNDPALRCRVEQAAIVIACWGSVPWAQRRIDEIFRNVFNEEKRWHCLRLTKADYP
jgi:hypothetical protein